AKIAPPLARERSLKAIDKVRSVSVQAKEFAHRIADPGRHMGQESDDHQGPRHVFRSTTCSRNRSSRAASRGSKLALRTSAHTTSLACLTSSSLPVAR